MSKTCIITSTNRKGSCESTSVMVHCRNALTLSRALGWDLIEGEEDAHKLDNKYDNIICNYASFYMPWKAYFERIMDTQRDARLWWMVNDHDVEDNVLLRNILKATGCKRTYGVISNNSREGFRQWILRKWIDKGVRRLNDCIDEWHTINLNALTFEDRTMDRYAPNSFDLLPLSYPTIYWGSWRKWRLPYYQRYAHPEIFFSTSAKNRKKLEANGCGDYTFIDKLQWGRDGTLARSNVTVYLEDPHTHDNYAFPANRFYEAISYDVNVYIDKHCRKNAERFGYDGLEYVDNPMLLTRLASRWHPNPIDWITKACEEKARAISEIKSIL